MRNLEIRTETELHVLMNAVYERLQNMEEESFVGEKDTLLRQYKELQAKEIYFNKTLQNSVKL